LENGWLFLGSRIGPFRRWSRWQVSGIQRLSVYVYPNKAAGTAGATTAPAEVGCLVVSFTDNSPSGKLKTPVNLIAGFSRPEILALANHLHARMGAAVGGVVQPVRLPPIDVVETQEEPEFPVSAIGQSVYRRFITGPLVHFGGAIGLGFLTNAYVRLVGWHNPLTRLLVVAAWVGELVVLTTAGALWNG